MERALNRCEIVYTRNLAFGHKGPCGAHQGHKEGDTSKTLANLSHTQT